MNSRVILLLCVTAFAIVCGLFELASRDFWWQYPRPLAWLVVTLYWSALAVLLIGGIASARLAFGSSAAVHGAWRVIGAIALLGAGVLTSTLVDTDVRSGVTFYGSIARGNEKPADIRYNSETGRIVINDELRFGSAARFQEVIRSTPQAKVVEVGGPGGLIWEARWISQQIEERGMDTLVTGRCMSACVDIFASGLKRSMHAKAVVGLHSARSTSDQAVAEANRRFSERLYRVGVEPRFLMVGTETPADGIWINTARQALVAGLATSVFE